MDLNVNFLKTFITLVEVGNYTKTAKQLHMTQPGVSQHVKWLEEYFDVELLSKHGKIFEVTSEGQKIYQYGIELFAGHQVFLQSFKDDLPYAGKCRFASPGSFGIKMYSFLLNYNKAHPQLSIEYFYSPNSSIEKELLSDELDIGFMSVLPRDKSLKSIEIDKEKLCLVAPASLKDTSFESLVNLGFIYHPDGIVMADEILSLNYPKEYKGMDKIRKSGANNQINRILEPVALGFGFTVLPENACKSFKNQKKIQYIKLKKESISTIYAVSKKYRSLPKRFTHILNEISNF